MGRLTHDDRGVDDAVGVGADVIAVDDSPFVAVGGTMEMVGAPVIDPLAAVPVLMFHVITLAPLVVTNILLVLIIVVVLGEDGGAAGEGECESGNSDGSPYVHLPMNSFPGFDGGGGRMRCAEENIPARQPGRAAFSSNAAECKRSGYCISSSGAAHYTDSQAVPCISLPARLCR